MNNYRDKVIITSTSEHLSILNCRDFCKKFILVDILENGIIDLNKLEEVLQTYSGDILVSIIYANNETGIVQPIKDIAILCRKYSAKLHTDAVQAIGKIEFDIKDLDVDFMTISGHKFGGPIGAGLLIYKKDIALIPHIYGGGQEKNLRSGTENMIAIKALDKALEITMLNLKEDIKYMRNLRDKLENLIIKISPKVKIIGRDVERLPNTSNIILKGISSEKQLIEFDLENIALSTGSACSSGKIGKSHVLKAMKLNQDEIDCSIRVSLGPRNNEEEIIKFTEVFSRLSSNLMDAEINPL
jgi:cysteine desulfurase